MSSSKPADAFDYPSPTKGLQDFAAKLITAFDGVLPSNNPPYKRVSVYAFRWANDKTGADLLETELLHVFRDIYNFETTTHVISTDLEHPTINLEYHLRAWSRENSGKNTLRIYVYCGHAESTPASGDSWHIGGQGNDQGELIGSTIDWWSIRDKMRKLDGDVLYIFDCPSAGLAASKDGPETIGATGWEQSDDRVSYTPFSFTPALIKILRALRGKRGTITEIYSLIFRHAFDKRQTPFPIHIPKKGERSITLAPWAQQTARPVPRSQGLPHQVTHRVLLSVNLTGCADKDDVTDWHGWITRNIPPRVLPVGVKIEAVFMESSTILVTVPVEIWTRLDCDDPYIKFVAHVSSTNVLDALDPKLDRARQLW